MAICDVPLLEMVIRIAGVQHGLQFMMGTEDVASQLHLFHPHPHQPKHQPLPQLAQFRNQNMKWVENVKLTEIAWETFVAIRGCAFASLTVFTLVMEFVSLPHPRLTMSWENIVPTMPAVLAISTA